ncbi:MAG: VOC family protein [Sphingobacterium sp.]
MVRTETIIAVRDLRLSAKFYQELLGCRRAHGGESFEILMSGEAVVLCLHPWGDHAHPTMMDVQVPSGNGLILFFRTDNLKETFERAKALNADVEQAIHFNENSMKNQFTMRDLDGYYIIVSE